MDDRHMIRHFLAALAYRFQKAIRGAPDGFSDLEVGWGVRAPLDIVHHIDGVLGYALWAIERGEGSSRRHREMSDWRGEVAAVHATLRAIDDALATGDAIEAERLERALQGPLADAMTHVGQLAMLRRMAGSPTPGENFYRADIRTGRVGEDQPLPTPSDD